MGRDNRAMQLATHHGSGGFTFVELLVATAVLAIGGLIAFPTMLSFFDLSRTARDENIVTHDLAAAVEEVQSTPFTRILANFPPGSAVPKFNDLHLNDERIVVTYADVSADPLEVIVTASWSDHRGRSRQESFRCLRTP